MFLMKRVSRIYLGLGGSITRPVVTLAGRLSACNAEFAFDPLEKIYINSWPWPLLNIKGVVSKCHGGFLRREAVRCLKLGVLTADSRLVGGWKVIKSHIIRGFIGFGRIDCDCICRTLWRRFIGHLGRNVQLLCHKSVCSLARWNH